MREIVAARLGEIITNIPSQIREAVEADMPIEWLDRFHMQFMSRCDLGINWDKLAQGPTLFVIDKDNVPHAPDYKEEEK